MVALIEYTIGLFMVALDFVLRIMPIPVSEASLENLEETANRFRRLGLLRKYHAELIKKARRVPVRCFAEESFRDKHKRGEYDSRGLVLFPNHTVMYYDLGQSSRLDPYEYLPGDATVNLHTKEPHRPGERVWVELSGNGTTRFLQCDAGRQTNEKTRELFDRIQSALRERDEAE